MRRKMIKLQTNDKSGFCKGGWKRYQNLCHVRCMISFTTSYCGQLLCQFSHTFVGFLSRLSKKVSKQGGLSNKHELSPVFFACFHSLPSSPKWMCGPITCSGMENTPRAQTTSFVARASKGKGMNWLTLFIRNWMWFSRYWRSVLIALVRNTFFLKSILRAIRVHLNAIGWCIQYKYNY